MCYSAKCLLISKHFGIFWDLPSVIDFSLILDWFGNRHDMIYILLDVSRCLKAPNVTLGLFHVSGNSLKSVHVG